MTEKKFCKTLYFQALGAIPIGILFGYFCPAAGVAMKPLRDGFVRLIKMMIAPIIFCAVVIGIASMESMKAAGKTGRLAVCYFEVVSTFALLNGIVIVNIFRPRAGMNVDPAKLDTRTIAPHTERAQVQSTKNFLLNIIPTSVLDAFAKGEIL